MKFNPTPLVEAKADIMAHAKLFKMDQFVGFTNDRDWNDLIQKIDCNTTFCIAGSITIRYFGIIVDSHGYPHPASVNKEKDWDTDWDDDWEGYARSVAGMTEAEAKALFYQCSWGQIAPRFYNLPPTAKNACIVIDEFLRQKGYDPRGQPA